ncbi:MAG: hypothetical protein IIY55_12370 [Blautia sp.]|nr:hypothetical protein [Blautia sp.]
MDTPTIAAYYKEADPMKRKKLLEESIANGEDPEMNRIREELWEIRYREKGYSGGPERADGFLGLWMTLEFNRNAGNRLFGKKSIKKDIMKHLSRLEFERFWNGSEMEKEAFYRECCHMVWIYMQLCETDKAYNTYLMGLMGMKKEQSENKLIRDIIETGIELPEVIGMGTELEAVTKAAREMFALKFPQEAGSLR